MGGLGCAPEVRQSRPSIDNGRLGVCARVALVQKRGSQPRGSPCCAKMDQQMVQVRQRLPLLRQNGPKNGPSAPEAPPVAPNGPKNGPSAPEPSPCCAKMDHFSVQVRQRLRQNGPKNGPSAPEPPLSILLHLLPKVDLGMLLKTFWERCR